MATIETRTTPEGKTSYRVKIRIRGFPAQSVTFERKTDAKNWAAQTESAIREGRYFKNTAAKKYTVGDLIARYLEHQQNGMLHSLFTRSLRSRPHLGIASLPHHHYISYTLSLAALTR